ncbi:alpha-glucanase [Colletotrichum musicola]|uniref:Alpha-glucanase n=1 Tax=Colletotrichum musicola TaxID=2175873 RepID=A0A8H6KA74_9PEZI|nr:alpha-glucanase [Colletotrichum musicola]
MKLLLVLACSLSWLIKTNAAAVFAHFMAQEAHIDAFALNMAYDDPTNEDSVAAAFQHASSLGFQLFFSFDYAGNRPWPKAERPGTNNFRYNGKPFVSTFEGPESAEDWLDIKPATGCFFIPDWSSLGAKLAVEKAGGVADGLFNWAAWPWGDQNMDTYVDASYKQWQQVLWWKPDFVQIISWNDYGESHSIGPNRDKSMEAFTIGKAPYNFVLPHDGWRETLPFSIDMYKHNTTTIDSERLVTWYRPNPRTACNDGVGGVKQEASWSSEPEGGVGLYHGNARFYDSTGDVHVRILRGSVIAEVAGIPITEDCSKTNGYTNWNAWVGSARSSGSVSVKPRSLADQVCVNGACHCTKLGAQKPLPEWRGIQAFPAKGKTTDYQGICQYACNYGFCPSAYCGTVEYPPIIATVSPFLPATCTRGEAMSTAAFFDEICAFACAHGFCPIAVCYCSAQGSLDLLEPTETSDVRTMEGAPDDHGLCAFSCARGTCPSICVGSEYSDPWANGYYLPEYSVEDDEIYPEGVIDHCDPTTRQKTLDDLIDGIESEAYERVCWNRWAVWILSDSLDNFPQNYAEVSKDYDDAFGYYIEWVKERITPSLQSYMDLDTGEGNKYFTCAWTTSGRTRSGPCPPSEKFWQLQQSWSFQYTLSDPDGFYEAIERDLGIEKSWVKFGEWHDNGECIDTGDRPIKGPKTPCRKMKLSKTGIPVMGDDVRVTNPKDVLQAAMPSVSSLPLRTLGAFYAMMVGYVDDTTDVVQGLATPVFMLKSALESMKRIKQIANEQQERDKKRLIIEILSIVLLVIPFAREAVSAAFGDVAMVARISMLIGEAGSLALTVESVISDPLSAPFAILSMLIPPVGGSGARTTAEAFKDAAAARRGLSASKLALFDERFVAQDAKIQKIVTRCS